MAETINSLPESIRQYIAALTASLGLACYRDGGMPEGLIAAAALFRARAQAGNQIYAARDEEGPE